MEYWDLIWPGTSCGVIIELERGNTVKVSPFRTRWLSTRCRTSFVQSITYIKSNLITWYSALREAVLIPLKYNTGSILRRRHSGIGTIQVVDCPNVSVNA